MSRLPKQIIIASVFLIAVGSIVYFSFIKNSLEPIPTPIASIQPPLILSQHLLKVGDLDYDFLAEIKNPNFDFGAAALLYELSLFDSNNRLIAMKTGTMNLLPGQTRYEIISPIRTDEEIGNAELKITNLAWEGLKGFIPQNLFLTKNQEYSSLPPDQGFSKLKATLSNNSSFDFDLVDVHVVLFGRNDEILAVGKTDIRTFLAKTDRFFEIKWARPPVGPAARIGIYPYTDVFKNDNFIKEHGTQERFQKFY